MPNEHYTFQCWEDNNGTQLSVANPWDITMTQDLSIKARFVAEHYTVSVTFDGDGAEYGTVEGTGLYPYLTEVSLLVASTSTMVEFANWSDGVTDNPRVFTLTQDTAFQAIMQVLGAIDDQEAQPVLIMTSGLSIALQGVQRQSLLVTDIMGRVLYSTASYEDGTSIRFATPGIYFVKVADRPANKVLLR